jgi:hypothetical protein
VDMTFSSDQSMVFDVLVDLNTYIR